MTMPAADGPINQLTTEMDLGDSSQANRNTNLDTGMTWHHSFSLGFL
jgi:hypothetical protein